MYEGSLVGSGALVFSVMGYVIAKQRPAGEIGKQRMEVLLNPKVIAPILGEMEAGVQKAIEFLCAPDPLTTTPGEEGRRLVKIGNFQYWVVNGWKYRQERQAEIRREQNRLAQQRYRAKVNPLSLNGQPSTSERISLEGELNRATRELATVKDCDLEPGKTRKKELKARIEFLRKSLGVVA